MLLSALKKRWPILTTLVAALLWLLNNYNIRGLDGLRLEPRTATKQPDYSANVPLGYPTSYPNGPSLPGTSPGLGASVGYTGQLGNASSPFGNTSLPGGLALPDTLNIDTLRPAVKALGGQEWDQLLSVGEKLGMLERTSQAVPSAAPIYQTQSAVSPSAGPQLTNWMQPRDTIRIASFNLSGWGDLKADRPAATEMLVRLMAQFDIVALQDIQSRRDDLLPNLMIQLNRGGRAFDFMIGPRVGRGQARSQLAFVFDTDRVETDRFQLYTVSDPEDIMAREPLVGWFRTRQVDSREAFTFSLVNIHIDGNLAANELVALPNLVEAIYQDGRGEDDVILAGDFSAAAPQSAFFAAGQYRSAIEGIATNTQGTHLLDNVAIPVAGTSEYMGRAGAVDFLRQYNLSMEQALAISEHLPVWAEFSIVEGGRPGQVAGNLMPERNFHSGPTN